MSALAPAPLYRPFATYLLPLHPLRPLASAVPCTSSRAGSCTSHLPIRKIWVRSEGGAASLPPHPSPAPIHPSLPCLYSLPPLPCSLLSFPSYSLLPSLPPSLTREGGRFLEERCSASQVECGRRRRREHSHVWRPVPPPLCRDEWSKGLGISSECAHIAHAHSARDAEGGPLFQVEGDTEEGSLNDRAQMTDRMLPHLAVVPGSLGEANTSFVAELAGSGPWRWGSSGPFAFLRGGILLTPWGVGLWGVQRSTPDGSTELARPNQVFADFAGSFHTLSWFSRECLRLTSTRKADGDKVLCPLSSPICGQRKSSMRSCFLVAGWSGT